MTDDRTQARKEAAELLGVDVERLSPADALRCDMIASLRLVIDAEQSAVLSGNQADLGKLNTAVTSLIALLPNRELPAQEANEPDPRTIMWQTYLGMRRRGALAGEGLDGLKLTVERLQAENAALKAQLAGLPAPAATAEPAPAPDNVVPLRASAPVAPPKQPANWDSVVNGVWKPPEARVPAPAAPPEPAPQAPQYELAPPEPWRAFLGKPPFV